MVGVSGSHVIWRMIPMRDVRRFSGTVVRIDLMRLPTRVGLMKDVQNGGLHVAQCELALWSRNGEKELGSTNVEGPT